MPNYKITFAALIYLTILLSACGQKNASNNSIPTSKEVEASHDSLHSSTDKNIIQHVHRTYFVGDLNNDNKADTADVIYDRSIRANKTIEKECVNKNCEVIIKFSSKIPDLVIDQSLRSCFKTYLRRFNMSGIIAKQLHRIARHFF